VLSGVLSTRQLESVRPEETWHHNKEADFLGLDSDFRLRKFMTLLAKFMTLLAKFMTVLAKFMTVLAKFMIVLAKFMTILAKFMTILAKFMTILAKFMLELVLSSSKPKINKFDYFWRIDN